MKRFTSHTHSSRSPFEVLTALADPQTWSAHGGRAEVLSSPAQGLRLKVSAPVSAEGLPAAIRGHLPGGAELVQEVTAPPVTEDTSAVVVAITAGVPGAPVDFVCDLSLQQADSGTDIAVDGTVTSSVPLFGGVVEAAVAPYVERLLTERLEQLG